MTERPTQLFATTHDETVKIILAAQNGEYEILSMKEGSKTKQPRYLWEFTIRYPAAEQGSLL